MAQTQDLEPVFAETSGFYIFRKEDYLQSNTRIKREYPVEISELEGIDIDTEEDTKQHYERSATNVIRHSRLIFCQLYPKLCMRIQTLRESTFPHRI